MHPELLNNSLFVRYYNQWRDDPKSVVFVPIAEYFLRYGLVDEAIQIVQQGLEQHPHLVTGRLVLAKAFCRLQRWERAKEQLAAVLNMMSGHLGALQMLREIDEREERMQVQKIETVARPVAGSPPQGSPSQGWQTVTMARIFVSQGHLDQAKEVYENILTRDPRNEAALNGLKELKGNPT